MSGGNDTEEKTLPPSDRKLREARKKGQLARSRDLVAAVVTMAAAGYLFARCGSLFARLTEALDLAGRSTGQPFLEAAGPLAGSLLAGIGWTVAPLALLVVASAFTAAALGNGGLILAVDPVLPKMERLNPVDGFKRLFSLKNLLEVLKGVVKVAVTGLTALVLLAAGIQALLEQPACGIACAAPLLRALLGPLLATACVIFLVIGLFDIGLQRWLFRRDMRMTKSELKRERKEMDGDPLIKRQHRRERHATLQAVRTGLRNATFVIRSHEAALAFRFARPDATVPILVARAHAEGMPILLDEARFSGLPVVFEAEAVRSLRGLKVGQAIGKKHFQAVIGCMRQAKLL